MGIGNDLQEIEFRIGDILRKTNPDKTPSMRLLRIVDANYDPKSEKVFVNTIVMSKANAFSHLTLTLTPRCAEYLAFVLSKELLKIHGGENGH